MTKLMDETLGFLTVEEIRQIRMLIETLEQSDLDFLQLESGNIKLKLGKGDMPVDQGMSAGGPKDLVTTLPTDLRTETGDDELTPTAVGPTKKQQTKDLPPDGPVTITAPIVGRFYAKPDPGADPFVTRGATIQKDDTVGLIEVMKVFSAVQSGVTGTVREICVEDGQIVEFGQILFCVEPFESTLENPSGDSSGEGEDLSP